MWPDRVSNPGPLTYESGALPTALRGPALWRHTKYCGIPLIPGFHERPDLQGIVLEDKRRL